MSNFPRFTDLNAIAAEIEGMPEYRRVRSAIEKAARAQSCVSDLAEAETCIAALDDILSSVRRSGTKTRSATEAALLRTAVTLYERATAAGAKRGERGSIQIAHHLTAHQLDDHNALVELRQRSLAHVYPGAAPRTADAHRAGRPVETCFCVPTNPVSQRYLSPTETPASGCLDSGSGAVSRQHPQADRDNGRASVTLGSF